MSVNTRLAAQALAPPERPAARRPDATTTAAPDPGLGFEDLIDAVNPLQHLPVVSAVYREASGDGISLPSRLAGAFLFGGPTGLAGAVALTVFEEVTGDTILGHLSGLFGGETEGETEGEGTAARPPGEAPAGSRDGATLPWLAAVDTAGAPALPSAAAVAEALDRLKAKIPAPATGAAGLAGPTGLGMAAAAGGADGARPAPRTLARLYELQAMQPNRHAGRSGGGAG